jgi:hypothetical protein
MNDPKKAFLEVAALATSNPKEFKRRLEEMSMAEFMEYESERFRWLEAQDVARKEKRLH